MTAITKRLNGIDLHQPARGWSLQVASTVRPPVSVRRSTLTIPRSHGTRRTGRPPVFDEPTVRLSWLLSATSQATLEENYHDLVRLMHSPALTYEHVVDDVVTVAEAELESVSEPEDFLVATHMRVTALLALPGVFMRDPAPSSVTVAAGESSQTALAGSGPIADAVVRWEIPSVQMFSLADVTTGTGISVTPASSSGTYLYVDAASLRAWRSSSATAWANTGTSGEDAGVSYPTAGPLQLWPAPLTSEGLVVGRAAFLNASHSCVVRARRAWL